jgi:CheY-like chemotaxis protein
MRARALLFPRNARGAKGKGAGSMVTNWQKSRRRGRVFRSVLRRRLVGTPPDALVSSPSPSPSPSVLVVDDEPAFASVLTRLLTRAGIRAESCTSSVRALERILSGERFDAVLCDGQMPGLRGVELFRCARLVWPELGARILFVSGGLREDDLQFVQEQGLPLLEKPLGGGERFQTAVRELIARACGSTGTGTGTPGDIGRRRTAREGSDDRGGSNHRDTR